MFHKFWKSLVTLSNTTRLLTINQKKEKTINSTATIIILETTSMTTRTIILLLLILGTLLSKMKLPSSNISTLNLSNLGEFWSQ